MKCLFFVEGWTVKVEEKGRGWPDNKLKNTFFMCVFTAFLCIDLYININVIAIDVYVAKDGYVYGVGGDIIKCFRGINFYFIILDQNVVNTSVKLPNTPQTIEYCIWLRTDPVANLPSAKYWFNFFFYFCVKPSFIKYDRRASYLW